MCVHFVPCSTVSFDPFQLSQRRSSVSCSSSLLLIRAAFHADFSLVLISFIPFTLSTLMTASDVYGLYHEADFSIKYGYLYITIIVNVSVLYAFLVLASFYSALKYKLKPFQPVGKFLCIKFIIFIAFWQVGTI